MSVNIVLWLLVVLASGYLFVLSTFTLGAMLWAWRDYHRPVASGAAPEGKLSFTLLVPARHEEAVIGATLDGLASLDILTTRFWSSSVMTTPAPPRWRRRLQPAIQG